MALCQLLAFLSESKSKCKHAIIRFSFIHLFKSKTFIYDDWIRYYEKREIVRTGKRKWKMWTDLLNAWHLYTYCIQSYGKTKTVLFVRYKWLYQDYKSRKRQWNQLSELNRVVSVFFCVQKTFWRQWWRNILKIIHKFTFGIIMTERQSKSVWNFPQLKC